MTLKLIIYIFQERGNEQNRTIVAQHITPRWQDKINVKQNYLTQICLTYQSSASTVNWHPIAKSTRYICFCLQCNVSRFSTSVFRAHIRLQCSSIYFKRSADGTNFVIIKEVLYWILGAIYWTRENIKITEVRTLINHSKAYLAFQEFRHATQYVRNFWRYLEHGVTETVTIHWNMKGT